MNGGEHSKQRKKQAQRPCGRRVPGMFGKSHFSPRGPATFVSVQNVTGINVFFFFFAMVHGMWGLRSLARGRSHTLCSGSTESGPPGMPLRSHAESARARSAFLPAPEFLGQLCCPCRRPATATLQARISPNLLGFFVVVFPQFPQDSLLISPPSCFPLPPMPLISQRSPHTSAYPWGHPGVGCGCRHRAERGVAGAGEGWG